MSLKKCLINRRAQSAVEYIVTFAVLAAGVLVVFGAFSPDNLSIKSAFDRAVDNAITEINRQ